MEEAIIICVGNYKGGVGKTKNTILNAYHFALQGKKSLVIDLDPQANATTVLLRTKQNVSDDVFSFNKTLMTAIKEEDLDGLEVEIQDNLYLMPSYIDFANYSTFLDLTYGLVDEEDDTFHDITAKKLNHFKELLKPLKKKYDYIFIDVPPTKSYITDSAVIASDYVLIVLQTQELSLEGATMYLRDLQALAELYDGSFEICGVLPVLMDNNATLDKFVLDNAAEMFGDGNIFKNKIPNMARLKRFDNTGITDSDQHDNRVHKLYKKVAKELHERIQFFEEGGGAQ